MESFYTIKQNVETELIEKKSKFITNLCYIESKYEAITILENVRKKYKDATHNCYAYIVIEDKQKNNKCSDDR